MYKNREVIGFLEDTLVGETIKTDIPSMKPLFVALLNNIKTKHGEHS